MFFSDFINNGYVSAGSLAVANPGRMLNPGKQIAHLRCTTSKQCSLTCVPSIWILLFFSLLHQVTTTLRGWWQWCQFWFTLWHGKDDDTKHNAWWMKSMCMWNCLMSDTLLYGTVFKGTKHIRSPGNEKAFQELPFAFFSMAFSRDSLSYCSAQETGSHQGSAVWRSAVLCRALSKQRGSFWWLLPPCYHKQLWAAPFY